MKHDARAGQGDFTPHEKRMDLTSPFTSPATLAHTAWEPRMPRRHLELPPCAFFVQNSLCPFSSGDDFPPYLLLCNPF